MDFNGLELLHSEFTFATPWYAWITLVLLPQVVAIVTKRFANSRVKDLTLAALAIVSALLIESNGTFYIDTFLLTFLFLFVGACGVHYRFLKKWGITGSGGLLANWSPMADRGIGSKYGDGDLPELPGEGQAKDYPKLQDPPPQ